MQKHFALTGHVYGPALVLMSANVYEGLSAADKANFDKAGKESAQAMRAYVDNIEKTGVEQLKKEGMQVTEVDRAASPPPSSRPTPSTTRSTTRS